MPRIWHISFYEVGLMIDYARQRAEEPNQREPLKGGRDLGDETKELNPEDLEQAAGGAVRTDPEGSRENEDKYLIAGM